MKGHTKKHAESTRTHPTPDENRHKREKRSNFYFSNLPSKESGYHKYKSSNKQSQENSVNFCIISN